MEQDYYKEFQNEYLKKAVLSYPPKSITIGVTSACSNRCLFCSYHGEFAKKNSNVYGLPFMLSIADLKKIVDMANRGGVKQVHVCGTGEPFMNPDILEMLDYVIDVYGKVSFQTNFHKVLFDKRKYLDEIVNRSKDIAFITVDVCSSNADEHNRIKKGSDYYELLDAIKYISQRCDINIKAFLILTKSNCSNIKGIIDDFLERGVRNFELAIGNLFSYDLSDFTSSNNVYVSTDVDITKMLKELVQYGRERDVLVSIPKPADERTQICDVFWTKFQTWPVKGISKTKYGENMVPHACAAVVKGNLKSLGYIFDYDNIMDAWNSKELIEIRKNLLNGIYPSEYCRNCFLCNKDDQYYKTMVKNKGVVKK